MLSGMFTSALFLFAFPPWRCLAQCVARKPGDVNVLPDFLVVLQLVVAYSPQNEPEVRQDYALNLSISVSAGKDTN